MTKTVPTAAALVDAGRELFGRQGFEGASVRAITRLAGANLGAVTYHFGSKDALYRAVLARGLEPLAAGVAEVAAQPGTSLDRVEWAVRLCYEYMSENPDVPRLLMQVAASGRPLPDPARAAFERVLSILAGIIADGQAEGAIRTADPHLSALSVIAEPIHLWLAHQLPGRDRRDELEEHAVEFVLAGLRTGVSRRGRRRRVSRGEGASPRRERTPALDRS